MLRHISLLCLCPLAFVACSDAPLPKHKADGSPGTDGTIVFVDAPLTPNDGGVDSLPSPKQLSAVTSGSRLEAPQISADGLSMWAGRWFDKQLGVQCTFAALPDGSLRCVPSGTSIGGLHYEDDACSGPALVGISRATYDAWEACNTPATERFVRYSSYPCIPEDLHGVRSRVSRVFTPAERIEPAKVYQLNNGNCVGFDAIDGVYYHRTTELELASFVGATVEEGTPESGGRLAPVEIVADDGARERIAFFDTSRGERCVFTKTGDESFHCMPDFNIVALSGLHYSDAECSQPVALGPSSSCGGVGYVRQVEVDDTCLRTTRIFEVGEASSAFYLDFGGDCKQSTTSLPVHAVGDEVAASSFATATPVVGSTAGRLKAYGLDTEIAPLPEHGLWDSQLELRCTFRSAGDGKTRCLPTEVSVELNTFHDAQCLDPVAGSTCPLETPYLRITEENTSGCGSITRIYARGAGLAAGATVYHLRGTDCVESASNSDYHYTFGAEVAPETFVEGMLQ